MKLNNIKKIRIKKGEAFIGIIPCRMPLGFDNHAHEVKYTQTLGVKNTQFLLTKSELRGRVETLLAISKIITDTEITQIYN